MAIFSCTVGVVRRSKGKQVCAAAAYQAREAIRDERQGQRFKYRNRNGEELLVAEIMLPPDAPQWDRPTLWNMVERVERRKDAQTARTIRLALPRELNHEKMLNLVRRFLKRHFVARGLAVDFAIHDKPASDGRRQPHVHVLVTLRVLTAHGFAAKKDRETFRNPARLIEFREAWASAVNSALAAAKVHEVVDHRSIADQRKKIEALLANPGLAPKDRCTLRAIRISLLRAPEKKSPVREWQAASRQNKIPRDVELAREAAFKAEDEAAELLELIEQLDVPLQPNPVNEGMRLVPAHAPDDSINDGQQGQEFDAGSVNRL
jgi:ATP-dependent exoDNAse (exonuclease V) alpha subunit